MMDMWNTLFQKAWFGPFSLPEIYPTDKRECRKIIGPMGHPVYADPECYEPAGPVYDIGPFDGLKTTSMWAQRFAQIPIVNYAQARPVMGGSMGETTFCPPGTMPVPTGVPGQSKCVPWSPPSAMISPQPTGVVGSTVPGSATPNQITYPVRAFYGWDKRGL